MGFHSWVGRVEVGRGSLALLLLAVLNMEMLFEEMPDVLKHALLESRYPAGSSVCV